MEKKAEKWKSGKLPKVVNIFNGKIRSGTPHYPCILIQYYAYTLTYFCYFSGYGHQEIICEFFSIKHVVYLCLWLYFLIMSKYFIFVISFTADNILWKKAWEILPENIF